MALQEFAMLAVAHWLALVSPGPDFLLLVRNALRHGRCNGVGTSLGIACANGVYIVAALAGLSLLLRSPVLSAVMKSLVGGLTRDGFWRGFVAGFLSGGLNSKNGLFYLGLFTLMVSSCTGMHTRMLYGLWMFAAVFVWDTGVVLAVSNTRVTAHLGRYFARAEYVAGIILLCGGALLASAAATRDLKMR